MRRHVVIVGMAMIGALATATPASADGGAYLELARTYYLAGDQAIVTATVRIPEKQMEILDLGPFFAYALPPNAGLREGKAIPDEAVILGSMSIEPSGRDTRLDLSFTMPALPPGDYSIEICNEPCTIAGFREPLAGFFTVVETRREARLIVQNYRLQSRVYSLKRQLKKVERTQVPRTDLSSMRAERDELAAQVQDLLREAKARAATERPVRPLIGGWPALALCISVLSAAAMLLRRRRRAAVVGEVIVEPPDATETVEAREPAGVR